MKKLLPIFAIVAALIFSAPQAQAAVTFDNSAGSNFTATGGVGSGSITIGSNTNRILIVIMGGLNSGQSGAVSAGGNAMTHIDIAAGVSGSATADDFILVAPPTGSVTLSFSGIGSGNKVAWCAYSYYNAAQSGQPDNHSTDSERTVANASITPNVDKTLLWGAAYDQDGNSSTFSSAPDVPNNQCAPSFFLNPFTQIYLAGDNGIISPASAQNMSFTESSGGSFERILAFSMTIAPAPPPVIPPSILNWIESWWSAL